MDKTTKEIDLAIVTSNKQEQVEITDESLVAVASKGDETAFEKLFERHRRRIARLVGRFFSRPETVEDIVQDIFTKLYFALAHFSAERGKSFTSWLVSIAINACYDELRRVKRRPENTISDIMTDQATWLTTQIHQQGSNTNAESNVIARDLANKLLAKLSAEDRLLLTLLEVEELSVNEIATLTGWSVSKVKVRAHRARLALRNLLSRFQ